MKKLAVALAALFASAAIACGSTTDSTNEEVDVEVESTTDTQAYCYTVYTCTRGGSYTSSTACRSRCAGACFIEGRCCGNACSWR